MIEVFTFNFKGHDLHTIVQNGEYWLVFSSILDGMGIGDRGFAGLPEAELRYFDLEDISQDWTEPMTGEWTAVSEYGAYLLTHLMCPSKSWEFRQWLAREVTSTMDAYLSSHHETCIGADVSNAAGNSDVLMDKCERDIRAVKEAFIKTVLSQSTEKHLTTQV